MGAGSVFIDQMGYEVKLPHIPKRVVSLVPSQTELLYYLDLQDSLVGVTKFCIHPAEKTRLTAKVGGTKKFNFDVIDSLNPDLIIGNKEENYFEGIERLKEKYPVWLSDVDSLNTALVMIKLIGNIFNKTVEADHLAKTIESKFDALPYFKNLSTLYFIWDSPKMVVGKKTFIDEIMKLGGFENKVSSDRYPEISQETLKEMQPEVVLLSSEPFPFSDKHVKNYKEIFPRSQILVVDGEMFSWYGSRLLLTPDYLIQVRERLMPTCSKSDQ